MQLIDPLKRHRECVLGSVTSGVEVAKTTKRKSDRHVLKLLDERLPRVRVAGAGGLGDDGDRWLHNSHCTSRSQPGDKPLPRPRPKASGGLRQAESGCDHACPPASGEAAVRDGHEPPFGQVQGDATVCNAGDC
jgi:hypothetical protein